MSPTLLHPIIAALDALDADALDALAFCDCCALVLPVLDNLGAAFAPAKSDVKGNIERLRDAAMTASDGGAIAVWDVIRAEKARGDASGSKSVARGTLWLKRFLEFTCDLLRRLGSDRAMKVGDASNASYKQTLAPFHGWLSKTAFSVVLSFPPSTSTFVASLGGDAAYEAMATMATKFDPILKRVDSFLTEEGLNDPTPV
jgi:hypothetical protein